MLTISSGTWNPERLDTVLRIGSAAPSMNCATRPNIDARKLPTPRMCDAAGSEQSGDDEDARNDCEHELNCARRTRRQIAPWKNEGEHFSGIVLES